jgi:hypothetical protein
MTDNKGRTPSDAKSPHCLWHGELKRILKCEYLHVMYSINTSEAHQPNELKLNRKHLWKVLSKECTFCYNPLPNMDYMAHHRQFLFLFGWFLKKSSPLKPLGQMNRNLVGTIYGRFSIKCGSFGWGISEEKIKMWKVNGRRTPSDGKSSHCLWQGELKKSKGTAFLLTPYLYTFSLYENTSFIIFSAETEYISTRSWYRNINFLSNRY